MHEQFIKILDERLPKFAEEVPLSIPALGTMKLPKLKPIVAEATKGDMSTSFDMKSIALPEQKSERETQVNEPQTEEPVNENPISGEQGTTTPSNN